MRIGFIKDSKIANTVIDNIRNTILIGSDLSKNILWRTIGKNVTISAMIMLMVTLRIRFRSESEENNTLSLDSSLTDVEETVNEGSR